MWRTIYNTANKVSNAKANYICLMTMQDYNGKFSIYIVKMKNSFEVAPDLLVMRNSKSFWGGLFKKSKYVVGSQPH